MPASRHAAHSKCIKGKDTTTMTATKKSPKLFAQWQIACARAKNIHTSPFRLRHQAVTDRFIWVLVVSIFFSSAYSVCMSIKAYVPCVWQLSSKLHLHDETIRFTFCFSFRFYSYVFFYFFFSTSCSFFFFEQTIRGVFSAFNASA